MTIQNTTYHPNQFTPPQAQAFTAKERDAATGLDYFGARYYSSGLSVWLSVDALAGEDPNKSPFCYAGLNPVMITDPNGMLKDWYQNDDGQYLWSAESSDNIKFNGIFISTDNFFFNYKSENTLKSIKLGDKFKVPLQ